MPRIIQRDLAAHARRSRSSDVGLCLGGGSPVKSGGCPDRGTRVLSDVPHLERLFGFCGERGIALSLGRLHTPEYNDLYPPLGCANSKPARNSRRFEIVKQENTTPDIMESVRRLAHIRRFARIDIPSVTSWTCERRYFLGRMGATNQCITTYGRRIVSPPLVESPWKPTTTPFNTNQDSAKTLRGEAKSTASRLVGPSGRACGARFVRWRYGLFAALR